MKLNKGRKRAPVSVRAEDEADEKGLSGQAKERYVGGAIQHAKENAEKPAAPKETARKPARDYRAGKTFEERYPNRRDSLPPDVTREYEEATTEYNTIHRSGESFSLAAKQNRSPAWVAHVKESRAAEERLRNAKEEVAKRGVFPWQFNY